MKRRERTRQLIELGGLAAKAGLIDLTDDDRAVLYGAMLEIAATLRGEQREHGADALAAGEANERSRTKFRARD